MPRILELFTVSVMLYHIDERGCVFRGYFLTTLSDSKIITTKTEHESVVQEGDLDPLVK